MRQKSDPGGLRDRELRALKIGLLAIAEGREEDFDGRRLGYSPRHHDLRDCAEIKVPVVQESRYGQELGPSHRLIYREFEAEDGGLPYREAICFEHRRADRPFDVAGNRLHRLIGARLPDLAGIPNPRPALGPQSEVWSAGPPRQPLPPDLRKALAAASSVAPAAGATIPPPAPASSVRATPGTHRNPHDERGL